MLHELSIRSLGVIDEEFVEFSSGLTVLTGETGAGKTMVVSSLQLLSGAKANPDRIRTGAEKAVVEGRFDLSDATVEFMENTGAQADDDRTVVAARSVNADGRSRAYLGGRSIPVGVLGNFTTALLAIHGQNDQLRLLKEEHQRSALDRFAGELVAKRLAAFQLHRSKWIDCSDRLTSLRENSRTLALEADQLSMALKEIEAISPEPSEDEQLIATIATLSELEMLRTNADAAHVLVHGDDNVDVVGALELIGRLRAQLQSATAGSLTQIQPRVAEVLAILADIGDELTQYRADLPTDTSELEKLLTRQAELKVLVKKYAPDINGVRQWAETARSRLAEIENPAASIEKLAAEVQEAEAALAISAAALTKARVKAAQSLGDKVSAELTELAMGDATLTVAVSAAAPSPGDRVLEVAGTTYRVGSRGVDAVVFGLVSHPGAAALAIARSASGGELSRVMLAIEVVLASAEGGGSTMVFDEVDAGVGGRAAVQIGKRLARLARSHQVIVVTHLPQVAAFADTHLLIGKQSTSAKHSQTVRATQGAVTSSVTPLVGLDRITEIARMLAGLGDSATGKAHAEELLAAAAAEKSTF